MKENRICVIILTEGWVKGCGHRVSFVRENEAGYYPGGGDGVAPWYWGCPNDEGKSFVEAEKTAEEYNRKLGHSKEDVQDIILSSMRLSMSHKHDR